MNFHHTEERRMLADSMNRFIAEQMPFEKRCKIAYSEQGYDAKIWQQFADLGVIAALFDEQHGGFGGTGFDIAVVFDAIGRGLVTEPFLTSAVLAGSAIANYGNATQQLLLEKIITGELIATLAHDEPLTHFDINHVKSHATQQEQNWVINGKKTGVAFAQNATYFVISASTNQGQNQPNGISLFLVPASSNGIAVHAFNNIDGGRSADIVLNNVVVSHENLIGNINAGAAMLEKIVGRGVLALCAQAVGLMDVLKDDTIEYLRTRKQFGVAIGSFQALQHRMADLLLDIEQARSAVINAAAALEGEYLAREKALSAAKMSIGAIGVKVAEECIQLHGGIGMTWELRLSHYAKQLVMIDHQLGDEDYHLQRYIALSNDLI